MRIISLRKTVARVVVCVSVLSTYGIELRANSDSMLNKKLNSMLFPAEYNIVEKKETIKVLKGSGASQEDKDYFITSYSLLLVPAEQGASNKHFDFSVKIKNLRYRGINQIHGMDNSGLIDDYTNPFASIITNLLFKIKIDENGRVINLSGYDELMEKIRTEFGNKYSNIEEQLASLEEAYFVNLIEVLLSRLPVCTDKRFIDLKFLNSCPAETGQSKRINTPYKIKEQGSQFAVIETSVSYDDKIETDDLVMPLSVIHTGTLTFDYLSNQLINSLSYTTSKGEVNLDTSKIFFNVKSELFIEVVKEENVGGVTNATFKFNGSGSMVKEYLLKGKESELKLSYEFFSDPDALTISDQAGKILYNSGMQSTKEAVSVNIPLMGVEKLVFRINTKSSKSQWRYEFSFK